MKTKLLLAALVIGIFVAIGLYGQKQVELLKKKEAENAAIWAEVIEKKLAERKNRIESAREKEVLKECLAQAEEDYYEYMARGYRFEESEEVYNEFEDIISEMQAVIEERCFDKYE